MDATTFIILLLIGLFAGIASGFVGIGGGIIIIPCLIYFLNLDQYQAQGVSLALMLPPIGVLAFYSYYQSPEADISKIHIIYAIIMAVFFVIGGWLGSKLSFRTPVHIVKLIFGILMLYASYKMIYSGITHYFQK
tara:strand:+ start:302 stop:706 length:405 start_codon:yes stop_codon:yes gene_type:complete